MIQCFANRQVTLHPLIFSFLFLSGQLYFKYPCITFQRQMLLLPRTLCFKRQHLWNYWIVADSTCPNISWKICCQFSRFGSGDTPKIQTYNWDKFPCNYFRRKHTHTHTNKKRELNIISIAVVTKNQNFDDLVFARYHYA